MIKVILLDVDNTLLSFDGYVREAMEEGFRLFGLGPYREEMFGVFCEVNGALWREIEKGTLSFEGLQEIRWNRVFDALGIEGDGPAFETYFRQKLFSHALPEKGALALLEELRGKYLLCVASNGPYHQQVNRLRVARMLPFFDLLFISEQMGASKPSREFFDLCIERIREKAGEEILPDQMLMVGDSLSSDMAGGRGAGMKTLLYNPTRRPIPREAPVDLAVHSLSEIPALL